MFIMARWRVLEQNLPLVMASMGGKSYVIDDTGVMSEQVLPQGKKGVIIFDVALQKTPEQTPFARFSKMFLTVILIFWIALLAWKVINTFKSPNKAKVR